MSVEHDRTIFRTGEYLTQFRPDDGRNPFRHIYARKRADVLAHVTQLLANAPDARILDIGGGMGRIAVPLAAQYHVDLGDISPAMLEQAQETARSMAVPPGHLRTHLVDASQRLPFDDATFDVVVCLDLLVHLTDPQAAVREIFRVLRPGGVALIDATNSVPLWVFWYPRYVGKRPTRWLQTLRFGGVLPEWATIVHHMRRADLRTWVRTAGFTLTGMQTYGPLSVTPKWFLAIARKDA